MYADYVLPIAHHYERQDYMLEARTPYVQVLDIAVPPLGEAVDDWTRARPAGRGDQRAGEGARHCAGHGRFLRPAAAP